MNPTHVSRALQLLAEESEGVGPRHVAQLLEIPPSNAHRLLTFLTKSGLASRDEKGSYTIGPLCYTLSQRVWQSGQLAQAARPVIDAVHKETKETVLLGQYMRGTGALQFVHAAFSDHELRYVVELGPLYSLFVGSTGRAIYSWLSDSQLQSELEIARDRGYAGATDTVDEIREYAHETRIEGVAVTHGDRVPGVVGVAAPIIVGGSVIGDVCISVPAHRSSSDLEAQWKKLIRDAADRIVRSMTNEWAP